MVKDHAAEQLLTSRWSDQAKQISFHWREASHRCSETNQRQKEVRVRKELVQYKILSGWPRPAGNMKQGTYSLGTEDYDGDQGRIIQIFLFVMYAPG